MHVLMTADAVGGVWSYALDLADGLAELDVSVTLAVTGAQLSSAQRAELRSSRVARCFAADFAVEWMPNPWRDVDRTVSWLREIEEAVQPDVVHLNAYAYGAAGFGAPVVVVAHSCVLSWFEAVRGHAAPPEWDRYRAAVAAGLGGADLVVAPTRAMLDAFGRHHPLPAETAVIPNGITASAVPLAREDVVLGAGRLWDEAKNVAALGRVAARVPWPVEVAGDGPAGDAANVRLLGRLGRAELRARMARARVFCAPARYEPFGLAALEAASTGCALVLGDIASLREVWGDAALYADPDDDEALAAAVARAMHEPCLAARAYLRSREYTRERMASAYVDAYEQLLTAQYERTGTAVRA
jgi:glycosyltransferase involved in cell wall biosynthesis